MLTIPKPNPCKESAVSLMASFIEGATIKRRFTFRDKKTKALIDLTGYTVVYTIKNDPTVDDVDADLLEYLTILDQVTNMGEAVLNVVMNIPVGEYMYDIVLIDQLGAKAPFMRGPVEILQRVYHGA